MTIGLLLKQFSDGIFTLISLEEFHYFISYIIGVEHDTKVRCIFDNKNFIFNLNYDSAMNSAGRVLS